MIEGYRGAGDPPSRYVAGSSFEEFADRDLFCCNTGGVFCLWHLVRSLRLEQLKLGE
jgi:hypothetical protein